MHVQGTLFIFTFPDKKKKERVGVIMHACWYISFSLVYK